MIPIGVKRERSKMYAQFDTSPSELVFWDSPSAYTNQENICVAWAIEKIIHDFAFILNQLQEW